MANRKKRITDTDISITSSVERDNWFEDGAKWFKELVESKKETITDELIKTANKEAAKRNSRKQPFYILSDICQVLDLQFPRDKEERNKLAKFSNTLQVKQNVDAALMLWNGLRATLTRETINHPVDIFLSKAETRKAKKRRKTEEKVGERKVKAVPKSDDEKAEARKERARIRKEAAKLGITTEEYKKQMDGAA